MSSDSTTEGSRMLSVSARVAVWSCSAVLLGGMLGCSSGGFGESVSLPQERHASLVDDFAAGQRLAVPQDVPFNLYDSQRSATAAGQAESSAEPAGRANCRASADNVGTATAEFQLGHVLDNRGQGPLNVTARFAVDYACRVVADPDDRTKPADKLGLRVFIRDSDRRVLERSMLTEAGEATLRNIRVAAIPSTDTGSAFLIEANGFRIYHAGDHTAAETPPEEAFTSGIAELARFAPVDLAFVPIFGCGLPNVESLRGGNDWTIERLAPRAVFPIHVRWTGHFYREEKHRLEALGLHRQVIATSLPGDRYLYRDGRVDTLAPLSQGD